MRNADGLGVINEENINELEMNLSTAIILFIKQSLRQRKAPIDLSLEEIPNAETRAAMREVEDMISGNLENEVLLQPQQKDVR